MRTANSILSLISFVTEHIVLVGHKACLCSFPVLKHGMPDLERVVPCSMPVGAGKPEIQKDVPLLSHMK